MGVRAVSEKKPVKGTGRGGRRPGAGRPPGAKTIRPSDVLIEQALVRDGALPVQFEGDSLEFLRAAMAGKFWPSREQLYAARAILPIEHPGKEIEQIKQEAIAEYIGANGGEDVEAAIIRQLDALRRTETMLDRVKAAFAFEPGDAPYTEEQAAAIEDILAIVDEHWPREVRGQVMPPVQSQPVVRKRESVIFEGEAEKVSAAQYDISMDYEAARSTHHSTHQSDADKPSQPSLWDDPAATLAPDRAFNPPQEVVQVTRGKRGGIAYIVNGQRRE